MFLARLSLTVGSRVLDLLKNRVFMQSVQVGNLADPTTRARPSQGLETGALTAPMHVYAGECGPSLAPAHDLRNASCDHITYLGIVTTYYSSARCTLRHFTEGSWTPRLFKRVMQSPMDHGWEVKLFPSLLNLDQALPSPS